jgi:lambda family phage portal protein
MLPASAESENRVLDFLRRAENPAPAPRRRARSHAEKFFAGSDWQSSLGTGSGTSRGGFDGAKFDRATEDWNPGTIGPNRLHHMDARVMRERARDLVINNPYAAAAVDAYICNVVECGISPKPQFDDEDRRKLWDRQWRIWGGLTAVADSQADITGHDSIYALQALWLKEVIEAGGCLIHFVELPRDRSNGRSLPLAIELIPEERFAEERDTGMLAPTGNTKTANPIIRGIEIDQATGRPAAYWIKPAMPNDVYFAPLTPVRIPADQCSYGFFRRRIGQYRGHTLLHAAIMYLWQLGYYVSNEMLASQMKSAWAYMIKTDGDADFDWLNPQDDDPTCATDAFGNTLEKITPGMVWRGMKGDEVDAVGPNVPQADSLPWIQLIERSIASGVHLSESELTRDYSRSNFSNTRAAANADRKRFRKMQDFTRSKFCNAVWRRFVQSAARFGIDGFPSQSDFMNNMEDWLEVRHRAPGWASVNPLDDARADQIEVEMNTTTREEIIAERGGDWEATFEQAAKEKIKLTSLDLNPVIDSTNATSEPAPSSASQEPANPAPARRPQPQSAPSRPARQAQPARPKKAGTP